MTTPLFSGSWENLGGTFWGGGVIACVNSGHAAAFLARTSGLDVTHVNAYTALLDGLDSDGLSCSLDILYIYATQDSTTALLNVIQDRFNGTAHGGPTFTADQGFSGTNASTTQYISTGFNPTTQAATSQLQQNAGHISVWNLTNTSSNFPAFGMGESGPDSQYNIYTKLVADGNAYWRINANSFGAPLTASADPRGHFLVTRSGFNIEPYKNGISSGTQFETSQNVGNLELYAAAVNVDGTANGSGMLTAAVTVGALLNATQAANLYARLCTYMSAVSSSICGCAEATAFLARTSGLDGVHISAYRGLICGLVTDGIWSKLDVLHVYATQDSATALLNLVSTSYNGVSHGSPTFTADRGFTGTAASATVYIDTQFNPSTAPSPKHVQNDAHLSIWSLTDAQGNEIDFGVNTGGASSDYILVRWIDNFAYWRINVAAITNDPSFNPGFGTGHFLGNRTGANGVAMYRNGANVFTTASSASAAPPNLNLYSIGNNFSGTPVGSGRQEAMISIGSKLDATQSANFYTRLRTYMTAVGVP